MLVSSREITVDNGRQKRSCGIMISFEKKNYGCIYTPETNFLCKLDGIVL